MLYLKMIKMKILIQKYIKIIVLKLENRDIKYLKEKDITIIEIKEIVEKLKDIIFLYYN